MLIPDSSGPVALPGAEEPVAGILDAKAGH
jgi:hypothetical protein